MQLFTSNGISEPSQPATFGYGRSSTRMRYGASGLHRRNENGLLAIVERHRDAIRGTATLPRPADQSRR